MTGKGFLFLFEPQLIVFQKKSFLHSPLRVLSKIVESISPYRVKVQQAKTKFTAMHNWITLEILCNNILLQNLQSRLKFFSDCYFYAINAQCLSILKKVNRIITA